MVKKLAIMVILLAVLSLFGACAGTPPPSTEAELPPDPTLPSQPTEAALPEPTLPSQPTKVEPPSEPTTPTASEPVLAELNLLAEPPAEGTVPSSVEAGILGTVPGVVGTLQATEAIKFILGIGELLINKLLIYEGLTASFRQVSVNRNPQCNLCGSNPSITRLKT